MVARCEEDNKQAIDQSAFWDEVRSCNILKPLLQPPDAIYDLEWFTLDFP